MITRTPASSAACTPSANGKKASDASTAPATGVSALPSASCVESTRDICPAPMPTVAVSRAITMAFERTCLTTRQANSRSPHSRSVGARAGHDLHRVAVLGLGVAILDQQAAEHAVGVALARRRAAALVRLQQAQVAQLVAQQVDRALAVAGRVQHLDELLGDELGELARERAVERDDAAEGRRRVGRERLAVGLLGRRARARTPQGLPCLTITQAGTRELLRRAWSRRRGRAGC